MVILELEEQVCKTLVIVTIYNNLSIVSAASHTGHIRWRRERG